MPVRRRRLNAINSPSCAAALALLLTGAGEAKELMLASLADLSLEELSRVEITSVSKRPEPLSDAPASVFVITNDEIRRSGATSLPEALRLAPNLLVSRDSASGYVITARGFSRTGNTVANKMLVLIDGRSVYSPLFAGVFWDMQDVMLEDIERIEVISGPAGTLWGTNAVNGVINIITRSAGATQGTLISAGAGSMERQGAVRYGGKLGDHGHYRVYAKHVDSKNTDAADGSARDDDWHRTQVGFRADWNLTAHRFGFQANAYDGKLSQPEPGALTLTGLDFDIGSIPISGLNLLAHWMHELSDGSSFSMQAYYDRVERNIRPVFDHTLEIFDVQFQHSLRPIGAHAFSWGAEYRYGVDSGDNTSAPFVELLPENPNQRWISLFAQDEISLTETLRLTLGARLENNEYTGNEFLPSIRLAWKFAPEHLLWTAISRAVRSPSRLDADFRAEFPLPSPPFTAPGHFVENRDIRSEEAVVYEIGYRGQPTQNFSFSLTAYHTEYDHLHTQEVQLIALDDVRAFFGNEMEGDTDGFEMWGTLKVSDTWRLSGGFTHLNKNLRLKRGSTDTTTILAEEDYDPERTWILRSSFDLANQSEFDATLRYVSDVAFTVPGAGRLNLGSYFAVDLRYAWRPRPDIELSVVGQNLFDGKHSEFANNLPPQFRSEFGPSVFFKFVGRY
jgi:iron complex outermembrane recepter protein